MQTASTLPQFVVAGGLGVVLLMTAGSVATLQAQRRRDRLRARIARIMAPHQRQTGSTEAGSGVALAEASESFAQLLARVFGFDPGIDEHHPIRWWIVLLVTLAAAAAAAWLAASMLGAAVLLGVAPIWIGLSRVCFNWFRARRREKLFVQFPDALAMLVRVVRVGIPVSDGIRAVARDLPAPTGGEFNRLADELAIGVAFEDAVKAMSHRTGLSEYRFFATALSLQNQTGGTLSETLENLAAVIRKRVAVRARGRALASEAQTSAIVLAALPPLATGALWWLDPDYIMLLFTDPTGRKILTVAVGGLASGILSMRYMIRKSLS